MKVNAKIICEVMDDGIRVELEGEAFKLFRGACTVVANLKSQLNYKEGTTDEDFYELLTEGIKNADRERKLQELMEKRESGEDVLNELLKTLKEALDD